MSRSLFKNENCNAFFEYFGLIVFVYAILKNGLKLLNNIGTFFMGKGSVDLKKYGSWAVVTGCTDGIGKAYAELLAKKGLKIVLISRTLEKLKEQAKYLTEKYNVETKVIACDFTDQTTIYPIIKNQISELDIGILLNNVGMGVEYPDFFDVMGQNSKFVSDMINCNVMSVTKMTAIVLPRMVSKKKGIIINNASAAGRVPTPLISLYSATKAFVDFFSRGLEIEYKSKGIIIQSLCPHFVSTKMSTVPRSFISPNPDEYVTEAIKTIDSQPITNGCLIHNFQGWVSEDLLPRKMFNFLSLKLLLKARNKLKEKKNKLQTKNK